MIWGILGVKPCISSAARLVSLASVGIALLMDMGPFIVCEPR